MTDPVFSERVRALLREYGYRLEAGAGFEELSAAFRRDKKRKDGRTRLVIPRGMGVIEVREATAEECAAALTEEKPRAKERKAQ